MVAFMKPAPAALLLLLCILTGCGSFNPARHPVVTQRPSACVCLLDQVDDAVDRNRVANSGAARVRGFPYLRADRFLSALSKKVTTAPQFHDWLHLMRSKADFAIEKEIANLPAAEIERIAQTAEIPPDRSTLLEKVLTCHSAVFHHDMGLPAYQDTVVSTIRIPSEYSTGMRIVGLYPLVSLPVVYLTHKAQKEFKGWFDTPEADLPKLGKLTAFIPDKRVVAVEAATRMVAAAPQNSLGMPVLDEKDIGRLASAFAPHLIQDVSGDFDVPGEVSWRDTAVTIDTQSPTLYYYPSYGLIGDCVVLQMNFVAWFSAREGPLSPWLERGPLDGLTIRLTFDQRGHPLILDIMNSCGCYHMVIPREGLIEKRKEKRFAVDAFIPRQLPSAFPEHPLQLRINAGWHQVQHISTAGPADIPVRPYTLRPYDELESLPRKDGRFESVFTHRGIMKNSKRIEPYILFSMGIPSVGFMRQRGHHAISLVGREYFDDPLLFEKSLVFK